MTPRPHGTRAKYNREKCRCVPCIQANTDYQRRWRESPPPLVDATLPRGRLTALLSLGWTFKAISDATGYSYQTLHDVIHKSKSVREETALDILSVPPTPRKDAV